jgi:uncharacterized membrane protein YqjE
MAEANRNITHLSRREAPPAEDLPSLIERLATNVATLFDQKVSLLKIELREEVNAYVRGAVLLLAGGVVAAVGLALANVALAFAVSTLFQDFNLSQPAKYALGFILTGVVYLIVGGGVILITKNRLAAQGIVPRRTVDELERDKEWLQKEL